MTVDALNMMLVALLVLLVLRQVMPIASGLAGGVSINSFGLASRGVGWGWRNAARAATPAMALAVPVARRLIGAVRGTGETERGAAVQSSRYVYGRAGAGIEALGRSWRHMRR